MSKKLIFDSCIVIDFFKDKPTTEAIDIVSLLAGNDCFISFITKLEALGYRDIPLREEINIRTFLSKTTLLPTSDAIEEETIKIRRSTNLKLPDAIIAATAIVIGAEVVTTDLHFLKCTYPALRLWQNGA
jgi:predicted nucleic acid-binding protein